MVQRTCATCGELFTPRRSAGKPQVRCSQKCRRKAANDNYTKKNAPVRVTQCAECGGPVEQAEYGRPRLFCSDPCKARVGNRRARRALLPARDPNPRERTCLYCGQVFSPKRRDQVYCSASTGSWCVQAAYQARRAAGEPLRQVEQRKTCNECGTEFTAQKSNAKWCSQTCRGRTTGREASRRRGPIRPESEPYVDREIFIRDGWRCHICGRQIDPEILRAKLDGATIDHVIPLVLGGHDKPSNVAAAHNRCNREKGKRVKALLPGIT